MMKIERCPSDSDGRKLPILAVRSEINVRPHHVNIHRSAHRLEGQDGPGRQGKTEEVSSKTYLICPLAYQEH